MTTADNARFWVSIRQTLAIQDFEAQVPRLVNACREFGVDEVLFFIYDMDLDHPATGYWPLETIAAHARQLASAKLELEKSGVKVGINPFTSIGQGDRGRDMHRLFSFQPLMDQYGNSCRAAACPLGTSWREYYRDVSRLWASIRPHRFFLDDDFRWLNHGIATKGGKTTCFCPLHLAEFERRYGRKVTREELIADILQPGAPYPARAQWLDLQRDVLEETAAMIEGAVHGVSPETEIGLMCSPPDFHAMEGRDWPRLLRALAGPGRPLLLRPHFGPYEEGALRHIPIALLTPRQTIAQFGRDEKITHFVELDNCPPTAYNRSPDYMAFQAMACAALGQGHFHYSVFEFTGNASIYDDGQEYGWMFRALRPCVDQVLSWTDGPRRDTGIGLIDNPASAYSRRLDPGASDYWALRVNSQAMGNGLQLLGYPVSFEPSPVQAPVADVLCAMDESRLHALLASNLLLDIAAAEVLVERGLGEFIGLSAIEHPDPTRNAVAAERITVPGHPLDGQHMHVRLFDTPPDRILKPLPGAQVLTQHIASFHQPVGPGTLLFRNRLGGRVGIVNSQANVIDSGVHLCPQRQQVMGLMLEFLFGDALQMRVRNLPLCLPLLSVHDRHILAVAGNVRSSPGRQALIQLRGKALKSLIEPTDRVEALLFAGGKLVPVGVTVLPPGADGWWSYQIDAPIPPLGMVFLKINTDNGKTGKLSA